MLCKVKILVFNILRVKYVVILVNIEVIVFVVLVFF